MAQVDVWSETDRGLKRESNQDSLLVDQNRGLFIVADGMGGHSGGEVASKIAVESAQAIVIEQHSTQLSGREILEKAYASANAEIFKEAKKNEKLRGMGTTMVMCYLRGRTLYIANVGDSRAYLYRDSSLWQITEDHSLLSDHLRAGLIKPEGIKNFVGRNVITRSVGFEKNVQVDIIERNFEKGDQFLLCSDGLYSMISDEEIERLFQLEQKPNLAKEFIRLSLAGGGEDNVSVIVVSFT